MSLAPRRRAFVAIFWLALATIFIHALAPTGSPLRRSSGSAFNPFTSEVALDPKRTAVLEKTKSFEGVSTAGDDRGDAGETSAPPILASATVGLTGPQAGAATPKAPPSLSGLATRRPFDARAPPSA